jgi:hypothetical protein
MAVSGAPDGANAPSQTETTTVKGPGGETLATTRIGACSAALGAPTAVATSTPALTESTRARAPSSIDQVMGQGDPKHSPALALLDAIARSYGGSPWWIR